MADDGPADPFSELQQAAASLHELFVSYVGAGFTEQQAIYLVGQILRPHPEP